MKRLINSTKRKKGVSLIETVIALAVISIVSVMAVNVSLFSIRSEQKNFRDFIITEKIETTINCFEFSSNEDELLSLLDKHGVLLEEEGYKIELNYSDNFTKINICAKDYKGKQIYQVDYAKRGAL